MHDSVNEKNFVMIGMRVVRGPGWKWEDQDGGEGHVGTIVELEGSKIPKNTVLVQWDVTKRRSNYRTGQKGLYDLYVLDSAPAEIKHERHKCVDCGVEVIRGTRWQCRKCEQMDLCTTCYMKALHCTQHTFMRHDTATSEPVAVDARSNCNKIQSYGLYKGARVVRGESWRPEWGNQDGGPGKEGTILSICGSSTSSQNDQSVAIVKWDCGNQDRYRVGFNGKVDLRCVEAAKGMQYYRSHLYVCGKINKSASITQPIEQGPSDGSSNFKVGDSVCFTLPDEILKELLIDHGGWSPKMAAFRAKEGLVHRITERGDVRVQYRSRSRDGPAKVKFTFHPAALELSSDDNSNPSSIEYDDVAQISCQQETSPTGRNIYNEKCRRMNNMRLSDDISPSSPADQPTASRAFKFAATGDLCNLRQCIEGDGSSLLRRSHEGFYLLHIASKHGRDAVILFLKEKASDMNVADGNGNTALHHAVSGKHLSTLKLLVRDCRLDINAAGMSGSTPLHLAAKEGYVEGIATLLKMGAEVNKQDLCGNTALHVSVKCNREMVSETLCSNPAIDLRIRDKDDMTVLHLSALRDSIRVASLILSNSSCQVDEVGGCNKRTPLHFAVERRNHEVAKIFLDKGANINGIDAQGNSPLHLACAAACLECVELLVRNGADPGKRNAGGETCLRILMQPSASSHLPLPQSKEYEQINDVIQRHHLSNNGTCDVKLLITCYLTFHGCPIDANFDHIWRGCLLKCFEVGSSLRSSKSSSSNDEVKALEEKMKHISGALEETLCAVCMDRPKNLVFLPCRHTICKECSTRLRICHICRQRIENRIDFLL